MQHKLEGYAAALFRSMDTATASAVLVDLTSLDRAILSQPELRGVLTDTSLNGPVRAAVLHEVIATKVQPDTLRVATYAALVSSAQDVPHAISDLAMMALIFKETGVIEHALLGLLAARLRIAGFADAALESVDTGDFARIEEELFRWARAIEANDDLRRVLLDRDAPLASREGLVEQLLTGKVHAATLVLARYVIEGGRPRDVVGTLDYLVDYIAKARDWRVARVFSARGLDADSEAQLVAALAALVGRNVELQVADDPSLLGGVVVEVGDLRLDASTKGRLGALHEAVASGRLYESALQRND